MGQKYRFCAQTQEEAGQWRQEFRRALKETLGITVLEEIADSRKGRESEEAKQRKNNKSSEASQSRGKAGTSEPGLVEQLECTKEEGYTRYKFRMETLPQVYMPFYMLVPDNISAQCPARAMIAVPAHGANKDTVAARLANKPVREKLRRTPKEAYGFEFVRRGYVVFCPDPPGYGERIELRSTEDRAFQTDSSEENCEDNVFIPDPLGCSCKDLAQTAEAFGLSLTALEIWDLMRLVDFAANRPEVDEERMGCAGFSGGGQYAMWLAAMDDRIRAAAVSGYVHGYYDSILDVHLCPCNYAPKLWLLGDISDICSLIAPRALFVENGLQDPLNGYRGITGPKEQVEKIREAYRVYGREENLLHVTPEGGHQWYGECYTFMDKVL